MEPTGLYPTPFEMGTDDEVAPIYSTSEAADAERNSHNLRIPLPSLTVTKGPASHGKGLSRTVDSLSAPLSVATAGVTGNPRIQCDVIKKDELPAGPLPAAGPPNLRRRGVGPK